MLQSNQLLELAIEKPAAGGRMIARHDRQVILVQGAIPGERVVARIQRVERQLAFADTIDVVEASADRQATAGDLTCGGCLYAHVTYPRQLALKAEVIQDAFTRLGRLPLAVAPMVAPSPERGYRLRARLHVKGERVGFYREGTHELCDARSTGQLSEAAVDSVVGAVEAMGRHGLAVSSVEMSENVRGDERALHVTAAGEPALTADDLDGAVTAAGVTGCTLRRHDGTMVTAGVPIVSDPLDLLTRSHGTSGSLSRHVESFFQANRFLLPDLVAAVIDATPPNGDVLDLYAGVGLFSVCLAAAGRSGITAVEGDRTSGTDLQRNANPFAPALRVWIDSVEDHLRRRKPRPATIIVDPPRTGISREAIEAVIGAGARRVVYVSCDPPTMARDARRLLDGGYRLTSLQAFDLFPNTPHVESAGVFDRAI
jgi:23S rRNA (uracil1939-C5)-methyltransferase